MTPRPTSAIPSATRGREPSRRSSRGGRNGGRGERRRGRGGRGRGGRGRDERDEDRDRDRGRDSRDRDREVDDEADDEGVPVTGVLEITSRGHGFVRREEDPDDDGDVYVSPSQIRRCELEDGDVISGPARRPRRGERHPALIHIDTVNGAEPGGDRSRFEDLEPAQPHRRIPLAGE